MNYRFYAATLFSLSLLTLTLPVSAALPSGGTLIKASGQAVYWYSKDGKRYVFPDEKTYRTWYADFSGVKTVTDAELASLPIGGNVTSRPGAKLLKIMTDPKTYAVDAHGTLRWVTSESVAAQLYGADWNRKVNDVPDAFFTNYAVGTPIDAASQFTPMAASDAASDIDADRAASVPVPAPSPTPAPVPDLPALIGSNDDGIVLAGQRNVILAKFNLTAVDEALRLTKVRVMLADPASAADLLRLRLYDGSTPVSSDAGMGSDGNADFSEVSFVIPRNGTKTLTVAADLNVIGQGARSGDDVSVKLHVPGSDDGTYELRGTSSGTVLHSGSGGDKTAFQKLLRKTVPTVSNVALPTGTLTNGTVVASRFTIAAAASEQVSLKKLTFNVSKTDALGIGSASLREAGSGADLAASAVLDSACASGAGSTCVVSLTLASEQTIPAGAAKTYELHLVVSGATGSASILTNLVGDAASSVGHLTGGGTAIDGVSRNFIWSDNAAVPHMDADAGSADWSDGRYVKILPNDVQALTKS